MVTTGNQNLFQLCSGYQVQPSVHPDWNSPYLLWRACREGPENWAELIPDENWKKKHKHKLIKEQDVLDIYQHLERCSVEGKEIIPTRLLKSKFLGHSGVLFQGNPAAVRHQSHHHHKLQRIYRKGGAVQHIHPSFFNPFFFQANSRQFPPACCTPADQWSCCTRSEPAAESWGGCAVTEPHKMNKNLPRGEKSSNGTDVQLSSSLVGTFCVLPLNKRYYFQRLLL